MPDDARLQTGGIQPVPTSPERPPRPVTHEVSVKGNRDVLQRPLAPWHYIDLHGLAFAPRQAHRDGCRRIRFKFRRTRLDLIHRSRKADHHLAPGRNGLEPVAKVTLPRFLRRKAPDVFLRGQRIAFALDLRKRPAVSFRQDAGRRQSLALLQQQNPVKVDVELAGVDDGQAQLRH